MAKNFTGKPKKNRGKPKKKRRNPKQAIGKTEIFLENFVIYLVKISKILKNSVIYFYLFISQIISVGQFFRLNKISVSFQQAETLKIN